MPCVPVFPVVPCVPGPPPSLPLDPYTYKVDVSGTVIPTPSSTFKGPYNVAFMLLDISTLEAICFGVANDPYMVNDPGSSVIVLATPPTAKSIDPLTVGIATLEFPFTISLVLATTPVN